MCGICGGITRYSQVDQQAVDTMNKSLTHRCPDSEGKFSIPHFAMSMRCLSIIDLNSGWQPLYNEDRSIAIMAIRGMFAFTLWDAKQNRLVLAHDRIGEKPLYLYETNDAIYFASEI